MSYSSLTIRSTVNNFSDKTIPPLFLNIIVIITIPLMCKFIYNDLQQLSLLVEPSTSFNKVLEGARYVSTRSLGHISYLSASFLRFLYSLGVVYFYYFCKEYFYPQTSKINKILIAIISILAFLSSILSAGRSELLGMMSAYLFIFLIFYSKKYAWNDQNYRNKVLKILFRTGISFIVLFLVVGVFILNRTGGNQGETIVSNLFKYLGSSIGALDYFINNREIYPENHSFAQNTFLSIYSTLTSLGLYSGDRTVFLPFVRIANSSTNVYSLYYYFIQDFGYFLGVMFQFAYGYIFGVLYFYIKKRNFNRFTIIIYALFSQAIVMSFFAEQLFSVLTNHLVRIMIAFVLLSLIKILSISKIKF